MKYRLIWTLAGLIFSSNVLSYDISEKFYFGINAGVTTPFYKSSASNDFKRSDKKFNLNLGLSLGKSFGKWGLGADLMVLEAIKSSKQTNRGFGILAVKETKNLTQVDLLMGLNGYYNFFINNNWVCKVILGLSVIQSVDQYETINESAFLGTNKTTDSKTYKLKIAPQVGLSAEYAFTDHLGAKAAINYLKPINHPYLSNLIYTNIGINIYV